MSKACPSNTGLYLFFKFFQLCAAGDLPVIFAGNDIYAIATSTVLWVGGVVSDHVISEKIESSQAQLFITSHI
jgi:hypothetical protein